MRMHEIHDVRCTVAMLQLFICESGNVVYFNEISRSRENLTLRYNLCGFLSVTDDCWESVKCRIVPEAPNIRAARSSQPATDGTRAWGENGPVSGKQQIVGISLFHALSESCQFYRSQQIIRSNMP